MCSFEQIIIHFKAIFSRLSGGYSSRATASGRLDQPALESKGFARRCRRFRYAE